MTRKILRVKMQNARRADRKAARGVNVVRMVLELPAAERAAVHESWKKHLAEKTGAYHGPRQGPVCPVQALTALVAALS